MKGLFARDAKLRDISDNALSVSDVVHKAEMKVDEQGASASAASGEITLLNDGPALRELYIQIHTHAAQVPWLARTHTTRKHL